MQEYNIKISELDAFPSVSDTPHTEDFFPMVNSSSMTTYRTTIQDIGMLITRSIYADTSSYLTNYAPTISASYASASMSASYAVSSSYAISASHANLADSASYYPPQNQTISASWASRSLQSWYATHSMDVDTHGVPYNFPYWTSNTPGTGNGNLQMDSPLVYYPVSGDAGLLAVDSASTMLTSYRPYPLHRPDFQVWQYRDGANVAYVNDTNNIGIQSFWPITSQTFVGTDQRQWSFSSASNFTPYTNSYYSGSAGDASSGSFYTIPLAVGALASVFNGKWVRFVSLGDNQNNGGDSDPGTVIADHASMGEATFIPGEIMKGLISLQAYTWDTSESERGAWSQIDLWVHCGAQGNGNPSATVLHVHNQGQIIRAFRITGVYGGGPDPTFAIDMLIDGLHQHERQLTVFAQSWQGIRFLKWLNVDPWPVVNTGSNDIRQDSTQLIFPAAPGYYSNAPKALNYYIQGKSVVIWPNPNEITQSGLAVPALAITHSLFVSGGINTNTAYYCNNSQGLSTRVTYGTTNLYFSGGILINKYPPDIVPPAPIGVPCGTTLAFGGNDYGMPDVQSVTLGSSTGPVLFHFDAYTVPNRFQVLFENIVVIDTGYRGNTTYQSALNTALAGYGSASSTIISPGSGTTVFQKNTATSVAMCKIFSPNINLPGASNAWNFTMSCPSQPLPS